MKASRPMLIHITGAAGSGTSTLGVALSQRLGAAHLDTDDFFWLPTVPPYTDRRAPVERRSQLLAALGRSRHTVVSGSLMGWGDEQENAFDLIVFLHVPTPVRIARLQHRETRRFGRANPAFLAWASQYDEGPKEGRSLAKHRAWLNARTCPVLALEGDLAVAVCLEVVLHRVQLEPTHDAAHDGSAH
ncbi:MAG: AAA family ATPase [Rhodoferax sp.]